MTTTQQPSTPSTAGLISVDSGEQLINHNSNWHMRSWLSVNTQTGQLTGYCHTWCTDNSPFGQGFHGAVAVQFVNAQGNLVGYLAPQRYGVSGGWDFTGPHDRQDSFPGQLDPAIAAQVAHVVFGFGYDPASEFLAEVEQTLVGTMNQTVGTVLNLITGQFAGVISWVGGL
jgi:hypothetical protein